MKRTTWRLIFIGILVLVIVVLLGTVWMLNKDINQLKSKHTELQEKYNRTVDYWNEKYNRTVKSWNKKYNQTVERYENRTDKLETEVSELKKDKESLKQQKEILKGELGRKYTFHLPTPHEVRDVVSETDIDERNWTEDYDCSEFSYDLIEALKKNGVSSCGVEITFVDGDGHIVVAVNTTEGIRYVEPQNDEIFEEIKIGENYCDKAGWECDWEDEISKVSSCYGILKN